MRASNLIDRWLPACFAAGALVACGGGGGNDNSMGGPGTAAGYVAKNLVSDVDASSNPYSASNVDSHLVNGWGVAFNPQGFVWVSDNGTSTSTLYDGNGVVDVFDSNFAPVVTAGAFRDASLPAGYAPFGIQAIGGLVYVSYAKQDPQSPDEVAGAGLGAVDVFDAAGTLVKRLIAAGGKLNAPWGLAMAPATFGAFSNALLVGNFGDGRINAFDPASGAFLGTLSRPDGTAIAIDGLWGIAFGNDINSQPVNTLFFAAGPGDESHGVYGRIDAQ